MSESFPTNNKSKPSIERLRGSLHGNDEAILEKGSSIEQQKFLEILQESSHHSRDELVTAVMSNYSGVAYGDYQWSRKSGGWTTPEELTLYGKFREAYPQFSELSLDAGFISHLPEFMEMIERGEITSSDCKEVRREFKEKLGYKTLYRGTMLTDAEFASIQENGLPSPLEQQVETAEHPKELFEAIALSAYVHDSIEQHFHGENYSTPYLSVSSHEDVAIAVGRHFGRKGEDRKLYLFKLQIPVIDLVSYKEGGVKKPYKLKEIQERNPNYTLSISVEGKEAEYPWDEDVESFVFWKINPEEIIEITQLEITESSWNNMKTVAKQ